jgi:glioma pathogenesis-related protein 2
MAAPNRDFQDALDRHNHYRRLHGTAPLRWSDELAAYAQDYANRGNFAHDTQLLHSLQQGENLATDYTDGAAGATDRMYNEVHEYDYNNPGFSTATGHFTQIVWRDTTHLGIGRGRTRDGATLYVFRFSPAGNVQGQFRRNVLPAGSRPASAQGQQVVSRPVRSPASR